MTIDHREWLEADGLGGFASGTVSGQRSRRYHALLLTATNPPSGRVVLVNGCETHVTSNGEAFALSTQHYEPNVIFPDGHRSLSAFTDDPWPTWTYQLSDGLRVRQELFVPYERSAVVLRWTILESAAGEARLTVRPLLSGRDYHSLHHENPKFRFTSEVTGDRVLWRPYRDIPAVSAWHNGVFRSDAQWFHQFRYEHESERGLDHTEDLAAPGSFEFDLARKQAVCVLTAEGLDAIASKPEGQSLQIVERLADKERLRRQNFPSRLERAGDAYLVRRGAGKTVIAGYPWFTDWGRDTFIALRGLCLATGRLAQAGQILRDWAGTVSQGMLPNRFTDAAGTPEFNSVDASLWFIISAQEYLTLAETACHVVANDERSTIIAAIEAILSGYAAGTRFGIVADDDGLLCAGQPGVQLTWMDAKVGDWVVTPRIGKPVEVQALWINALAIGARLSQEWLPCLDKARASFASRFWNEQESCLYDVIDVDHVKGSVDPAVRPNQIFAAGGLPLCLLDEERSRRVIDVVEQRLVTPLGLRTLDRLSPDYSPHYGGGVRDRDGAYHQGTVWPWLMGAFVQAWLRIRGHSSEARREAESRFLTPLLAHLEEAGLGHISEIADAEAPHVPRGCPFQAWSVGEVLRIRQLVNTSQNERNPLP